MSSQKLDVNSFLIPKPAQIKLGSVDQNTIFTSDWNFKSNCPSPRLRAHCEAFCQDINILNENLSQISPLLSKFQFPEEPNDPLMQEKYPFGFFQPRIPLYLLISPSTINISPEIVIKNITWQHPWNALDYRSTDEYHLLIGKFIQITSRSERGLYYGLQTLRQIVRLSGNQLPFETIQDAPALSLRTIHIDLKSNCPNASYLKDQSRIFAEYKINSVVIEWEDKFPFSDDLTLLSHPAALTASEKDDWLEFLSFHYIEAIPLIQSLGHFDYVLKHQSFQHLSELHDIECKSLLDQKLKYYMMCPSLPETRELVLKIHNQVVKGMGIHQESRFIHVGMDETYSLGRCIRCQPVVEENSPLGKPKLFVEHLSWITNYYLEKNKLPIVWCDMLVKHPQLMDQLDKRVIINDWEYEQPLPLSSESISVRKANIDRMGESIDWVRTWEVKSINELRKSPPENFEHFKKYWIHPNHQYPLRVFANNLFFSDQGYKVIAAPAIQSAEKTPYLSIMSKALVNIAYFNMIASKRNLFGSICTNWTIRGCMWPSLQFGFLLHAETAWSGEFEEEIGFSKKFWQNFFFTKLSMDVRDNVNKILVLFSMLSYMSLPFETLLNLFGTRSSNVQASYTDRHTIEQVIKKLPEYQRILEELLGKANRNQFYLRALVLVIKYSQLCGDALNLLPKIEEIGLALDEEKANALPSIDDLDTLESNLKILRNKTEKFEPEIDWLHNWYLHPAELSVNKDLRFGTLKDPIAILSASFPSFVEQMRSFVDQVVEMAMKRYGK